MLLSSGELRKFQLAKALLTQPRLLILDNPFIGLDAPTRDWLRSWLQQLVREVDLQLILVLSRVDELPDFITHVLEVADCTCGPKLPAVVQWGATSRPLGTGLCERSGAADFG